MFNSIFSSCCNFNFYGCIKRYISFNTFNYADAVFVFKMIMTKNSVMNDFQRSPILNEENTIRIYDEGLELIGSFEKVYAPWKSVYAVKETKKNLLYYLL